MVYRRIGKDFIINSYLPRSQTDSAMATLANGKIIAVWHSFDELDGSNGCIRARILNADGTGVGRDFIVNSTTFRDQEKPTVTALSDGKFVVSWEHESAIVLGSAEHEVRARVYYANGKPVGPDFAVSSSDPDYETEAPSITALAKGGFVVSFESEITHKITGRIFDSKGVPTGADFTLETSKNFVGGFGSHVTALASGGFVASWADGDGDRSGIWARIFARNGSPVGTDFLVNSTKIDNQNQPTITQLKNGNLVFAWSSTDDGDGSNSVVRARILTKNGTAIGRDFIVNTTTINIQTDPEVVFTSLDAGDGDDVVAVRGRVFSASGKADDEDFLLNTTVYGNQASPSITALAGGRFMASWTTSDGTSSVDNIRAAIFAPVGGEKPTGSGVPGKRFVGTSADNTIKGSLGDDVIIGGNGKDKLFGSNGNDTLNGGLGDDVLLGQNGSDFIVGGAGNDKLLGGNGDDVLIGGPGNDILIGGAGADTFIFNAALGASNIDTITDFEPGRDLIELDNAVFKGLSADLFLSPAAFTINNKGIATEKDDRVIYDRDSGVLLFDADGKDGKAAVEFARIDKLLKLTADDFFVV
jgi:Ca2+-binding RTX toxin-like protein